MDAITMSSEEFYARVENYLESASLQYKKELEEFMESGSGSGSSSLNVVSDTSKNFKSKLEKILKTIKERILQLIRDIKNKYNEVRLKALKEKAKKTEEKIKACEQAKHKKFPLPDFDSWEKDIKNCKDKIKKSKTVQGIDSTYESYRKKYKDKEKACKIILVTAVSVATATVVAGLVDGFLYDTKNIDKEFAEAFGHDDNVVGDIKFKEVTEAATYEDADLAMKKKIRIGQLIEDELYIAKRRIEEYDKILSEVDNAVNQYAKNMSM